MKVTQKVREWAVKSAGLAADASDELVTKTVVEAVAAGTLSMEQVGEMTKSSDAENRVREIVAEEITKSVTPKFDAIMQAITTKSAGTDGQVNADPQAAANAGHSAVGQPVATKDVAVTAKDGMTSAQKAMAMGNAAAGSDGANAGSEYRVRVKSVVEQFDDTRTALTWNKSSKDHLVKAFGSRQVTVGSVQGGEGVHGLDVPTERTKAIAGAWFKHLINKDCRSRGKQLPDHCYRMTDLDRQLVEYAVHECKFVGPVDFNNSSNDAEHWLTGEKVTSDLWKKTLLDDSISGGLEAVPYEFDDVAIITPLLNGEIFPYVEQVNVGRRRMHGYKIGNPTMSWGAGEGSDIPLLNTDSLIGAFDTTIYPIAGGIEIGLDFEADSPTGVGDTILQRFGQAFLTAMDDVLVNGDGVNRPLGLVNTPGVTAISSTTASGTPTVADYENLFFGIKKAYRQRPNRNFAYIGTELSYKRARQIKGNSDWQWRIYGVGNYESYQLGDSRYAINESLPNTKLLGACLSYYRLYRRLGYEVRVVTEDAELARKNKRLILVRARFGGQMTLAGAMSKITDAMA